MLPPSNPCDCDVAKVLCTTSIIVSKMIKLYENGADTVMLKNIVRL